MPLPIKGIQKTSLIDYPGKLSAVIFLGGCNFRCPFCFSGNNFVFTDKGPIKIKDLVEKNENCRVYDISGGFSSVSRFLKRKYSGPMVRINTYMNTEPVICTPKHKFFVASENGAIAEKKANELTKNDYISIKMPEGRHQIYLDVKKALINSFNELEYRKMSVGDDILHEVDVLRKSGMSWRRIFIELGVTDYVRRVYDKSYFSSRKIIPIIKKSGNMICLKGSRHFTHKKIKVDAEFARLIGYYLAEGCSSKSRKRKNSYYLSFTLNESEKETIRDIKRIVLRKLSIEMKEVHSRQYHTVTLVTYKSFAGMLFKYYFGSDVYSKKLPANFIFLDKIIQKELIKGLFLGDGITSKSYIRKYQRQRIQITSKHLLYQISLILYRLGILTSRFRNELITSDIKIFDILGQEKFILGRNKQNRVYNKISNKYAFVRIKDIKTTSVRNKTVYNLEINDPKHTFNVSLLNVSNCHNSELVLNPEKLPTISEEEVLKFLESRKRWIDGVVFGGGEPTIYNDLPFFIEKIKKLGFPVKLDTNGTNPVMLRQLIRADMLDYIAMDIKASLSKYEAAAGVKGNTIDVKESVKDIMASDVPYEFRTTVVPRLHSEADILEIGEWLRGAERFVLQQFRPVSTIDPSYLNEKPYPLEKLELFADKLRPLIKHVEVR